jgi:hypothetical protein
VLKEACSDLSVLVVLDDVWSRNHIQQCLVSTVLDFAKSSKIVISTRVTGVLEPYVAGIGAVRLRSDLDQPGSSAAVTPQEQGGIVPSSSDVSLADIDVHEIAVPSDGDAARMLLVAADVNPDADEHPLETPSIVRFCKRLPLALGIAGNRLRQMVGGSRSTHRWDGVTAVLERELAASGHAHSIEYTVIQVSLNSIDTAYRAQVVRLFSSFALVREDTFAPLEIVEMLYVACQVSVDGSISSSANVSAPPPRSSVRRWLKVLIDRSLVVGTVDRPQVSTRWVFFCTRE